MRAGTPPVASRPSFLIPRSALRSYERLRFRAAFLAPTFRATFLFAAFALRFAAPTLRATLARVVFALRLAPATFRPTARFAFETFAFTLRFAAPRLAARLRVLVAIVVSGNGWSYA